MYCEKKMNAVDRFWSVSFVRWVEEGNKKMGYKALDEAKTGATFWL